MFYLETQKNAEVPGWAIVDGVDKIVFQLLVQTLFRTVLRGLGLDCFYRAVAAV